MATRSFKVEVNTAGDPPDAWTSNGLRFTKEADANSYGFDLACRWTAVRDFRVVASDDIPNRFLREVREGVSELVTISR
jgi:hypothetical protein